MALDTAPVGIITAKLMEEIEREWPDAEFQDAIVIIEASVPDDKGGTGTVARYRCTSHRASVGLGMIDLTSAAIRNNFIVDDEGED